jgi:hypothetical protein
MKIKLTGRQPVEIDEAVWSVVARARDWEGEHECQSSRKWHIAVRRHRDGRHIVYATMSSAYTGESDSYAGEVVGVGADLIDAIRAVARDADCERLTAALIGDLPAERLE